MAKPATVTVAELAEAVGCDPATIRRHCANGTIQGASKPGRDWIIPTAAAEEYAEQYQPYQALRKEPRDQV